MSFSQLAAVKKDNIFVAPLTKLGPSYFVRALVFVILIFWKELKQSLFLLRNLWSAKFLGNGKSTNKTFSYDAHMLGTIIGRSNQYVDLQCNIVEQ